MFTAPQQGRFLDTIACHGLVSLLVWTPLAFGAVHPWAYALMEMHIFALMIAWMAQVMGSRKLSPTSRPPNRFAPLQFMLPLALFIALIVLQLTPLPAAALQRVSPSTYALYSLFHPDWPSVRSTLSLHPYATFIEFTKCLAYTGLFCYTIHTLRSPYQIRYVSLAIVAVATTMALIGIVQHLAGMTAIYGWRDASYTPFFGPFLNRNHFAAYQSMAILLGLGLFLAPTDPISYSSSPFSLRGWLSHPSTGQRLLLLFALSVMTGALVLSLSRGGIFGFLAGLLLLTLLLRHYRAGNRTRMLLALAALTATSLWLGLTPLIERFMHSVHGGPTVTWGERLSVYKATWTITQDFPLFGIGLEAFPVIFPQYRPAEVKLHYLQAHNDVLQLLAETGWIGFLSLMGSLLGLLTVIVKRWRQHPEPVVQAMVPAGLAACCSIALQSLVDFSLRIPANAILLTAILALTFACANLPRRGAMLHEF